MHPISRPTPITTHAVSAAPALRQGEVEVLWLNRPQSRRVARWALWLAAGAFATAVLATTTPADALQSNPASVGDSVLAQQQFIGKAARDGVVVRAGASESELAISTLRTGEEVVVIHARKPFLRILPPDGTFCLVAKARVNVRGTSGGEQTGRITESVTVRVGSNLTADISDTGVRLGTGDEVRVIGEDGIFYKIAPPKMVFFYVSMSDLAKDRQVHVKESPIGWSVAPATSPTQETAPQNPPALTDNTADTTTGDIDPAEANADDIESATDANLDTDPDILVNPLPTTRPTQSPLTSVFTTLDAYYEEQTQQPLEQQPLADLETQYTELLARIDEAGDSSSLGLKPVVEARLKTIAIRRSALDDLQAIRSMRAEVADRQASLEAERDELSERVEKGTITMYDAVGQMLPSTLQVRGGTLFRLCDPVTRRTLIYVRATDEATARALTGQLDRFVGVRGSIVQDRGLDLRYIEVAESAIVAQADVFGSVAAKLIPPSMVNPALAQSESGGDAQQAASQ